MGGELGFIDFARDGGGDDGRRVFIPDVVLHNKDGAYSALLASHDGGKIRIIQLTALYIHDTPLLKTEHTPSLLVYVGRVHAGSYLMVRVFPKKLGFIPRNKKYPPNGNFSVRGYHVSD